MNRKQPQWVIAYDLNVRAMKSAGYSKSKVTQYYDSVKNCLHQHGFGRFRRFRQLSIYGSEEEIENPLFKAIQIIDCLKAMPDAKYINRLHLFKVEDFNDLRPLLPPLEAGDEQDEIELKINNIFGAI